MSCSSTTSAIDTRSSATRGKNFKRANHSSNGIVDSISTRSSSTGSAPRRAIRTGSVDSRWLFNNFHVGELLIDARSRAEFERATILGAISTPAVSNCSTFADVIAQCSKTGSMERLSTRKRTLRDIVLFADDAQLADATSWLFTLQTLLETERLVASVKVLSNSFAAFRDRYPFYTSDAATANTLGVSDGIVQSGLRRVTYPNEIEDGFLYLGNMWQAESQQVIRDLGITHIVNATLDLENVFERDGIVYHEVKVKDVAEADIASFFDATFAFIDSARQQTVSATAAGTTGAPAALNRVLVHCTQGISRSATLVIMYLMRAHNWSLVTAYNHARAGRGVIIPNDGFLRALLEEERRLFGATSNSFGEHEFDRLLQQSSVDYKQVLTGAATRPSTSNSSSNCAVM